MSVIETMIYENLGAAFFAWMAISHQFDKSPRVIFWMAAIAASVSWLLAAIAFAVQVAEKK